jgi:DNA-binding transcriptional ArsR family regulator
MSGLLPSETEPNRSDGDGAVRVLSLDDDGTEDLIASLSTDTARTIYSALREEPATASELSDVVSTSIQNVRHHLSNLEDVGLVRVAGTRYSCKGREMNVYAPTQDSLVVCVGSPDHTERLVDASRQF